MKWDDDALMAIYYKKLKNLVKDEFMQYKVNFRSLKDFIYIFIKLDNKIFLRFIEKQDIKPRYNQTSFAY